MTTTKSKEKSEDDTKREKDWQEIRLVLGAGAIGGVLSWVFGFVSKEPVPGGGFALPIAMLLGAFAAGISVYVLANTDTSRVAHTFFFATLAGFAWKPVCDAGTAFIQQSVEHRENAAVEDTSSNLVAIANSLSNTSPAQITNKLEKIHDLALAAIELLPGINNLKVRRDVELKVSDALRNVTTVAPQHPHATAQVIQSVGEAAAKNQSPQIAAEAVTSLEKLSARDQAFVPAHRQLTTNINSVISARYRLSSTIRP